MKARPKRFNLPEPSDGLTQEEQMAKWLREQDLRKRKEKRETLRKETKERLASQNAGPILVKRQPK